ncbi:MAG TPA: hypothetical protein VFL66_04530 [Gaiellaceae bacterium]|nr:hypothetical protein [Gaiellaceae bacterium]
MSRRGSERKLAARLRRNRPEARQELVAAIVAGLPRRRPGARLRIGFAAALTAGLLVALASVGGIGYAASSATHAVRAVTHVFVGRAQRATLSIRGMSSGGDQYRPGYGWGDPNHNHSGPPGLTRKGGSFLPPLKAAFARDGKGRIVTFAFNVDEQAHLWISVINRRGKPILLDQNNRRGHSIVGGHVLKGPQAKFIQYAVLVPRSLTAKLRIPRHLLAAGKTYRIRIVAVDPQGHKSTLIIPFRA